MQARQHLIASTGMALAFYGGIHELAVFYLPSLMQSGTDTMTAKVAELSEYHIDLTWLSTTLGAALGACDDLFFSALKLPWVAQIVCILGIIVAYYIGALLPDIDQRNSTLGKRLYVPVVHRGVTHTVWIPLLAIALDALCGCYGVLAWLGLGMLTHDIADSWSIAKWVPFYPLPIPQYRIIERGQGDTKTKIVVVSGNYGGYPSDGGHQERLYAYCTLLFGIAVMALALLY